MIMNRDVRIANLIFVAKNDLGTKEEPLGSNDGVRIGQMLETCGITGGAFWCAAAVVQWVLESTNGTSGIRRSAACDDLLSQARVYNCVLGVPRVGDIFLRMNGDSQVDAVHTGIVTAINDTRVFRGLAGNTNDDGSRNGYEVAEKLINYDNGNYKFYSPFDIPDRPMAKKFHSPRLKIDGEWFECPYNYKDQRLYAHAASFVRAIDPLKTINARTFDMCTTKREINYYSFVQVRELFEKFGKSCSMTYDAETMIADIRLVKVDQP